jgi:hypothetical protein
VDTARRRRADGYVRRYAYPYGSHAALLAALKPFPLGKFPCVALAVMASAPPVSVNMEEDGFYMTGLSETRRTTDDGEGPATDGAMREILAAMPGAMKASDSSSSPSLMQRNSRFKPLTEHERRAARAEAADERREEAIRIKRRAVEVERQAQARYAPPADASCLCMTLVLVVLIGLWVADIYYEFMLAQSPSVNTRAAPQQPDARPVQHEDV